MTVRLADLGVRQDPGGLGRGVEAVLHEIAGRLERLAAGGAPDTIDLRSLPLDPFDRERLEQALGRGEVEATLSLEGPTRVRETAIAGVWWVEHRDPGGAVIAELIEIAAVPGILEAAAEDLDRGAQALRARLAGGAAT